MDRQPSHFVSTLALLVLLAAPGLAATKPRAAAAAKPQTAQASTVRRSPAPQTVWDSQFWKDMDPRVYRAFTPLDKKIFRTLTLDQYSDLLGGTEPAKIRLSTGESLAHFIAKTAAGPKELVFTALPPCRVIDTRGAGAGGKFAAGDTRSYVLRGPTTDYTSQGGNAAGCGIPDLAGVTVQGNVALALAINIVVVAPTAAGDMRAWPANQTIPTASVINYANVTGLNIANGVIVPMCDEQSATPCATGDISFHADVAGGFLVADVTGYFHEESSNITAVDAGTGLTGGGTSGDVTLSIDTPFQLPQACTDGQIPSWNAGSSLWQCSAASAGDITAVTADTGLAGGGTSGDVSLSVATSYRLPQVCTDGQLARWSLTNSDWECTDAATGTITSVASGTGLSGGATSGAATLSILPAFQLPQACADGQVAKWSAGSGTWICAADAVNPGTISEVDAGTGLTGGGTSGTVSLSVGPSYQLPQTCANGQVAVWNSGTSQWQCGGSSGGGGFGFGKADLYENVQAKQIAANSTDSVTVSCNDANDIPLEGTCRPVASADPVVVQSEMTLNWNNTGAAAQFVCGFHNNDSVQHNTQARIVCVTVP